MLSFYASKMVGRKFYQNAKDYQRNSLQVEKKLNFKKFKNLKFYACLIFTKKHRKTEI